MIRLANSSDAEALSSLLMQLGYATSPEECVHRIQLHHQDGYKLFVTELDKQIIAFIALHWYSAFHHPGPIGKIVAFCVDDTYRGKGLGSHLLTYAEDFFRTKSCIKIELTSNLRRKESHEYYFHRGYEQTSMHFVKYLTK